MVVANLPPEVISHETGRLMDVPTRGTPTGENMVSVMRLLARMLGAVTSRSAVVRPSLAVAATPARVRRS